MHCNVKHLYNTEMELNMSTEQQEQIEISAETVVKAPNPLLARLNKLPGTTIRLPSRGIFYTDGELSNDSVDGEVQLFPMTTTDELMMRSPDMLFQGTAIENVLKRCLPQISKPMQLLVGDIDYILTQLRRVSYGTHIPITYNCQCAKTEEEVKKRQISGSNQYNIPVDHFIQHTTELDIKDFNKKFKIVLGNGQRVVIRPIRYIDFVRLQQMNELSDTSNMDDIREFIGRNFAAVTVSVDDITDSELIIEWYKELPRFETELIRDKIDAIGQWGIDFKYTIKCVSCKKEQEITTQLNPLYFFMQPSSPKTPKK